MYLFSRVRAFDGRNSEKVITTAGELAADVAALTGIPVFTWQVMYHPTGSALAWSARVETMAQLEGANEKMAASDELRSKSEKIAELMGGTPVDSLNQVVAGSLGDKPAKYVSVTTARAANSHQKEAVEWGADLAVQVSKALDVPVAFAVSAFGNYGTLSWISAVEDAAGLDDSRGKLMASESLQRLIDDGGHLVQSEATQILLRRLG